MPNFTRLGSVELERMAAAAADVQECARVLAKSGLTVVSEALGGATESAADWAHYPAGDVYDPESHAQYFYHAHPAAERSMGEVGHFHTFLRPRGMPPGTRPHIMPELAIADAPAQPAVAVAPVAQPNQGADNDEPSHLVAIAMSAAGAPIRLFTTNRWVTGETWYAGTDVIAMLDCFVVDMARPSWPLNRWIGGMIRMFQPHIAELIKVRDEAIMSWRRRHRGKVHVLEDRRFEITSSCDIDVAEQRRRIMLALRQVA